MVYDIFVSQFTFRKNLPELRERRAHRPLDEHAGEATKAEEEGDGEQDVRDEREQHRTPMNLEAVLVLVRQVLLSGGGDHDAHKQEQPKIYS